MSELSSVDRETIKGSLKRGKKRNLRIREDIKPKPEKKNDRNIKEGS